ncbi:MAG: sensor domain-containing diguanylate cyclase [Nitrospirae bacterium]|nr:sensor domain-containing diguanylate cyclase [Nitrospirota bacterium]
METKTKYSNPLRLFLITILTIYLSEFVVMYVFPLLTPSLKLRGALLDTSLLILIVFPILYVLLIRPLKRQIIEMKKAEDAVREIKHDWEDTFNTITDMVTVHDKDFNIIRANRSAQRLLQLPVSETVLNAKCYRFYHGKDTPVKGCPSCNSLNTGKQCSFEIFEPHLDMFLEIRAIPRLDKDRKILGLIHVVRDITERKKMEEKLQNLSLTDELTGLYNRRGFFSLIEHHLKLARRQNRKLLLLYADMDNLKEVNDTFGHQEGDRMLVEAAGILKATYRESDIVARIGGDEFVVFPVGTSEDNALAISMRLQKNIDAHNAKGDSLYALSISVGVSCYDPAAPRSVDEMLAEADRLMYRDKRTKKEA